MNDNTLMYVPFHIHTMLSNGITNIDSVTDFHDYVNKAKSLGMKAFAFSEHGSLFAWVKKKEAIEEVGMKYIHAIEAYLTEDISPVITSITGNITLLNGKVLERAPVKQYYQREDGAWIATADYQIDDKYVTGYLDYNTLKIRKEPKKIRDNYHCVLIAKNYDGVKELNRMISKSFNREDGHFYYAPRITLDELFNTSDNIIITTACLGGVLNNGTEKAKEEMITFLKNNKDRCYLEIQHHNVKEQIDYNRFLFELSKSIGVPLIVGTDTHALTEEHMNARSILQKSKDVNFENESEWDLVFKTPQELIDAYKKQKSLPLDVVYEAMNNSIKMADSIEEFKLDYSPKYPKLYDDSEAVFKKKVNEGTIKRGIHKLPNRKEYYDRIHYEYNTYKHNNAIDFMLLEEDYKSEMRRRGVRFGYSRGSVSGSIIAYLLGITEVDSVKYNLNFERFMNTERVSLADVDTDWYSEDRKIVKDYLYSKRGLYCCDIVTFNTIALKGAIRDVCRGLAKDNIDKLPEEILASVKAWDKEQKEKMRNNGFGGGVEPEPYPKELQKLIVKYSVHKEIPIDHIKLANSIIDRIDNGEEEAVRKTYSELFYYVDIVSGVVVSVGNHPAGCVVSPFPVDEWFGTFTTSTNEYPISLLNMKEIDSLNFVKLDILGLDNVGLIYKTCDLAGIPYATPDNIPPDDEKVWQSIKQDTTMIFQWESPSATAYLKRLFSNETIRKIRGKNPNASYMDLLSIGNGAIRPAGESYRDKLANGEYATYGNQALDDFLKPTLGWLVYQEQIIEFLHSFCGYTMGEADVVRRGFAKKTGTEKFIPKIKNGFAKTMLEKYNVKPEESDKIIVNFIQVIEDASSYLFSKNHADPYSWIGYICGYLRYYYPLEFITTALNIFASKEDKSLAIINYAKSHNIVISPIKFRYSVSEYNFDKESNKIFKGIASIKYMNAQVADEMYQLRDNKYDSFIDLLYDLTEKTTLNSRQLKILIELDFFDEFGDANYLMKLYEYFDYFDGRLQIKKDILEREGFNMDLIRSCAGKESPKMFTKLDSKKLLQLIARDAHCPKRTLKEKIQAQIEHLGYVDIIDDRYSGMACVVSLDTKYAPKLKMYSLKHGTTLECKIDRRSFYKNKLEEGDIVMISGSRNKPKMKRDEDGQFVPVEGTNELWITSYKKMNNI